MPIRSCPKHTEQLRAFCGVSGFKRRADYGHSLLLRQKICCWRSDLGRSEKIVTYTKCPPMHLGIISILLSDTAFEISSLQSSNRCAHLHESYRTLRDGSFGVALSQALRARLRSCCPSGIKAFAHRRGPRIKSALMGFTLGKPPLIRCALKGVLETICRSLIAAYLPRCLSKNSAISPNATAVSGRRSSKRYCAWDWPHTPRVPPRLRRREGRDVLAPCC